MQASFVYPLWGISDSSSFNTALLISSPVFSGRMMESFVSFFYFNWRLIALQYCSGFCHSVTWFSMGVHVFPILNSHPISLGHPSAPALSTLSRELNLDWQSTSHMIIYMFQCYSLRSSHPRLLPQSPKDCFIHLCLFCCLAYRVIITIFLNSIYMH